MSPSRKYSTPSNWPKNIRYLNDIEWSNYQEHIQNGLKVSEADVERQKTFRTLPRTVIEVKLIEDHAHPLYHQYGLFAKDNIAVNTVIGSYVGQVVLDPKNSNYAYWLGSVGDQSYYVDAKVSTIP